MTWPGKGLHMKIALQEFEGDVMNHWRTGFSGLPVPSPERKYAITAGGFPGVGYMDIQ